jgi:hypothetical protein
MNPEVIPLTDFQHGSITLLQGVPDKRLSSMTAEELERKGLVRIKMAPVLRNQQAPDPAGKAPAGGEGTPSVSLPVAHLSPPTIAEPLRRGPGRPRKIVTSSS